MRGYHKPIMLAGGVGNVRALHAQKGDVPAGSLLVQLGGPGMLIGMGGGSASSMATGANTADLDFDSVQRGNAEIQRRAQEVIDRCCALGDVNPILSIHDVGAGGLSNALPELVHGSSRGARIDLRAAPNEEPGMTPREVWSNESQERYVLAIAPASLDFFRSLCERERCPFAVVGDGHRRPPPRGARPALRQQAGRHGPAGPPRQAAAHDARREAAAAAAASLLGGRHRPRRGREAGPAPPHGRGQDVPDHDRRPHGGRPLLARPDGRPVAGAGGRLRDDAPVLRGLRGRGLRPGRARARRRRRRPRLRSPGGGRGAHEPGGGAGRRSRASSSRPTGWRPPAPPARTRLSSTP